ncbi:MAG: CDP-diacylglycerol--glycerol-3-phosphate 3-phosphatidyltransferase [bacterium]
MHLVNKITLSRFFFAIIFYFLFEPKNIFFNYLAFACFVLAAISDFYDGRMARQYNIVTKFGQMVDPLADKLLLLCALLAFMQREIIPGWMVIIILGREFLVMGIRILSSAKGDVIPARESGKYKTVNQLEMIIISLCLILFHDTFNHFFIPLEQILNHNTFLDKLTLWIFNSGPYYLMFSTVVITVLSGIEYYNNNKELINE